MKKNLMKKTVACILTVSMVATAFTGCGSSKEKSTSTSGSSGKLEKVTMYGVSDPQISAQQIIATEKGFFEEEGIEADNVYVESSGDLPSYIAGGTAPVSFESTYTCTELQSQNVPMKMLMSTTDIGGTQCVVAGKNFKVNSAKDLEGAKMGMMNGSGIYIAVRNMAEELGIDYTKIEVVPLSPSEQVAALANGSIDMMACWEPWVSTAIAQGGTLLFSGIESNMPEKKGDVQWLHFYSTFQVTEEFYKEHYDLCVKMCRALVKATDYINNNMEECAEIIAKKINNDKDNVLKIMKENKYEAAFSQDFYEATMEMANYMKEMDNIDSVPEFDSYGEPSCLKEVDSKLVTYSK